MQHLVRYRKEGSPLMSRIDGSHGGYVDLKEVQLPTPMIPQAVKALAKYAVKGKLCAFGNPIYDFVTEGRQVWPKYSSCGDLPQFILWALGCRDEHIVNRDAVGSGWEIGQNLSKLVYGTKKHFVWAQHNDSRAPAVGDMLYVSMPEHVSIVIDWNVTAMTAVTCDYGQWDYKLGSCGKLKTHKLVCTRDGHTLVDNRTLQGWLDFTNIPFSARALVPEDFSLPEVPPPLKSKTSKL